MSELPEGWMEVGFEELNNFRSSTINPADTPEEVFELYSVPVFPTKRPEIVRGAEIGSTKQSVAPEDVLVCKINPRINRVWKVMPKTDKRQIASSEWIVMRAKGMDADFLRFYFSSHAFRQILCEDLTGVGGSLTRAQPKRVAKITVPVAPLTEQKRIAEKLEAVLGRVDSCRTRLDRVPALLKRFRRSVLAAATSGQLTEDWLDESSGKNWKTCLIRDAGAVQLGRQRAPKYHKGLNMHPYLRVQNVFEARLDLSDVMEMEFSPEDFNRYQLHFGDILLNEGQSPQFLGRPAMFKGELPNVCFTNTLIRFRADERVLNRDYALLVFRHYMHEGRFKDEGTITTNIAHLGAGRFASLEIRLPSLPEQQEIVRRVEALFALADRIEARLTAAQKAVERLTPAVLAKAFRGELVPQDPNDEPASALLERLRKVQTSR